MTDFKTCRKCGKTKSVNQFRADAGMKDGRRSTCKSCETGVRRISGWRGPTARLPRGIEL